MEKRNRPGKQTLMAALAGIGAALAVMWTPVGLIEMIVASTGLSEAVPAAAPPLGLTARLLLAVFAGVMAVGVAWVVGRDGATEHIVKSQRSGASDAVGGVKKMGLALSRLTAFARGHLASGSREEGPVIRRADAHPDAPARKPIFASRDFDGLDIFPQPGTRRPVRDAVVTVEPEVDPIVTADGLDMPNAPLALPESALPPVSAVPTFGRSEESVARPLATGATLLRQALEAVSVPAPLPASSAARTQSVAELTDRLERGLSHRNGSPAALADVPAITPAVRAANEDMVLAGMPSAAPVPIRPQVEPDVDAALSAALGTLRTMAARAR